MTTETNKELEAYDASSHIEKKLTPRQQQRFDYLQGMIGEKAFEIVQNLDARGKNSFQAVYEKITAILDARSEDLRYQDVIYDNIDIDTIYTPSQVIGIIAEVRKDLGLPPYLSNPKSQCLNDFCNLYIVKDEIVIHHTDDGKTKRELIGYKPIVRLKPEE